MSTHGHQIGGAVGFLKTLHKIVREQHPKQIIVTWESGGSTRRRALYKEYKENRKPEKLNRFYEDDIPDTDDNKIHQIKVLAKLLRQLPVCQIYVPDCEGDDVIAYLVRYKFQNENKIIASSDKDFYQLLDDKTKIYNFHKKRIITKEEILEETHIQCKNFALAKCICGDASDNIPGVQGMGFKTLAKRFPFFGGENKLTIEDVNNFALANQKRTPIYKKVVEAEQDIRRNWKLIYLDLNSISANQIERIEYMTDTFKPLSNKIAFIKCLIEEGITSFEVDNFFYTFLIVGTTS